MIMSDMTYPERDDPKRLIILKGEIKTPPMSREARREVGHLIRLLQEGFMLSMPKSRPMPSIGKGCHELRINDETVTWRIIYFIDTFAIIILDIFAKKTQKTPQKTISKCQKRLQQYKTYSKE